MVDADRRTNGTGMQNAHTSSGGSKQDLKVLSSEALLILIAVRDQQALQELFDRHQDDVYRFALQLGRDEGLAEDVTAETFCQVRRRAAEMFTGNARAMTWLLAIARNQVISALRRHSGQELDETTANTMEDLTDCQEVTFARLHQSRIVMHCLNCLPTKQRDAIDLFYFQDRSVREIAQIAGIPINKVKSRLLCGRALMAQLLKHFEIKRTDPIALGAAPPCSVLRPKASSAELV
jgi:RNA polymerase sigma-70 factor (ECF subfamily)